MKLRYAMALSVAAMALSGAALTMTEAKAAEAGRRATPSKAVPAAGRPAAKQVAPKQTVAKRVAARPAPKIRVAAAATKRIAAPSVAKPQRVRYAAGQKPEPKPDPTVRCVGRTEMGRAAWYGGHYIGQRTTSGERLDTIHPTAAHRTLPLNSLARVTNLANGRSVIVRVTDRGPISESLLIDMSPRAADQLAMKAAGIVPVKVEQVVEIRPDFK